jgi:hypothetical protein
MFSMPRYRRIISGVLSLTLGVCFVFTSAQAQQNADAPLTNSSIIKLVRAGFKDKTVIAIIRTRQTQFDLAPDRLIELKRGGVSENVILAMLVRDEGLVVSNNDFENDAFFNDGKNPTATKKAEPEDENTTDIFGSGSGSSGHTRSRGLNGNNEGDTQTSGSVSVKIVRPQAEEGGTPKLVRTPTLNNDSIVELVEAGFSEGTIIRRIEGSPVDFDMSPAKLAELRRRRVSDRIIAAMKAALGDDAATNTKPSGATP